MNKDLIEDKLYHLLHKFSKRKINHRDFYFVLLDNRHPFYDGNGRSYEILFVGIFN